VAAKAFKKLFYFIIVFAILLVLNRAETRMGLTPFALGFFVAMVYARQHFVPLSFAYVAAAYLLSPDLYTLIVSLAPPLVLTVAYYAHYLLKKPVNLFAINIYAFVAQIPSLFLASYGNGLYVTIFNVICSQMFCYSAIILVSAVVVRCFRYRLSVDELIAGAVFVAALSLGLYSVEIFGVQPFFCFAAFCILLAVTAAGGGAGAILGAVMGMGVALSTGDFAIAGAFTVWALFAAAFKKLNVYVCAFALVVAEAILGWYFDAYGGYSLVRLVAVIAGCVCFAAVSPKTRSAFSETFSSMRDGYAARTIVNRSRLDVASRLKEVSSAFCDISQSIKGGIAPEGNIKDDAVKVSLSLERKFCAGCTESGRCARILGDKRSIFAELAEAALDRGQIKLVEVPTYLTSVCSKAELLAGAVNEQVEQFRGKRKIKCEVDRGKAIVCEQIIGVKELIDKLAEEVKKNITFDTECEKRIIDELAKQNILCSEALVYGKGDTQEITVIVRDKDVAKARLARAVGRAVKQKLVVRDNTDSSFSELRAVHLVPAPTYDIVCGEKHAIKPSSPISGDIKSVTKINESKYIISLCDGMGSGVEAEETSALTVSVLESLYRAGFPSDITLASCNRLMTTSCEESFSALDLILLDLKSGACDLLKMAACPTVLKRADGVELIEGGALPIGIVCEMKPSAARRILSDGDILIMVSDGVADTLGIEAVCDYVASASSINPQELCANIIERATRVGGNDDMTAVGVRIFKRFIKQ